MVEGGGVQGPVAGEPGGCFQPVGAAGGEDDGYTSTVLNLSLKAGWNLLQENASQTQNGGTQSVSIAAKNIPWTVSRYDE
jgi:hypothetical protein